jgi:hypothetical protein
MLCCNGSDARGKNWSGKARRISASPSFTARDPLADFGSRPVREELWRRTDGGRIELAPIHFGEDQATIEELRAKGRPRLYHHARGSVEHQFGCCFRILDVDHALKVVAPHHVDEQRRQDMKMNIDGWHRFYEL